MDSGSEETEEPEVELKRLISVSLASAIKTTKNDLTCRWRCGVLPCLPWLQWHQLTSSKNDLRPITDDPSSRSQTCPAPFIKCVQKSPTMHFTSIRTSNGERAHVETARAARGQRSHLSPTLALILVLFGIISYPGTLWPAPAAPPSRTTSGLLVHTNAGLSSSSRRR